MPRKRVKHESSLCDWYEVDAALREIGEIDRLVAKAEALMNGQIDRAKERHKELVTEPLARKVAIEMDIKAFALARRDAGEFDKTRTKQLVFGTVGFRFVHKVKTLTKCTWKTVLAALRAAGAKRFLLTKYSVNKKKLDAAAIAGEDIAQYGVERVRDDVFGYTIAEQRLDPAAGER